MRRGPEIQYDSIAYWRSRRLVSTTFRRDTQGGDPSAILTVYLKITKSTRVRTHRAILQRTISGPSTLHGSPMPPHHPSDGSRPQRLNHLKMPSTDRQYYYTLRAREHSGLQSPYSRISKAVFVK